MATTLKTFTELPGPTPEQILCEMEKNILDRTCLGLAYPHCTAGIHNEAQLFRLASATGKAEYPLKRSPGFQAARWLLQK